MSARPQKRTPVLVALAAALLAAAVLIYLVLIRSSTSTATALHIVNPYGGTAGEGMSHVALNTPYVYVIYPMCVDSGSATITRVSVVDPRGSIEVVDWATRSPERGSTQVADGVPGRALGLPGFTHDAVATACSTDVDQLATQVAVSVKITSSAAAANAFLIHYQAGGDSGTELQPFSVTECTGGTCPHLASSEPTGSN
jgi:hypothetical protein